MKRLLLLAAISLSVSAFAQNSTDRGWRSVGGTGSINLDFNSDDGTYNSLALAPELYWFVGNSFALGVDFGFGFSTLKREDTTVLNRSQQINFWVAPGARYYMGNPENKWRPYAFGNAGYQYAVSRYDLDYKSSSATDVSGSSDLGGLRAYAGLGAAWFFTDHAAFDFRMTVLDFYPEIDDQGHRGIGFDYSPSFQIGIQAFFE